jgi:hypothetical protein
MLVSNKTIEGSTRVMRQLISSCHEAEQRFRFAASGADDLTLKRLLEIYAQQRNRFAEELKEHLPAYDTQYERQVSVSADGSAAVEGEQEDSIRSCLDGDSKTLQLYRQALAARDLPTRTHFLISSQLALMERARERVIGLVQNPPSALNQLSANVSRVRA